MADQADNPAAKRRKVFCDGTLAEFDREQLVPVREPWKELLRFIVEERKHIALIRAPPKAGKSFLGQLADRRRAKNQFRDLAGLDDAKYDVRYCANIKDLTEWVGTDSSMYKTMMDMAKHSGASQLDDKVPTIIYFFDEVHEIPEDVVNCFVKDTNGFAIFATAGIATQISGYTTPTELHDRMFVYRSPESKQTLTEWVAGRFRATFTEQERGGAEAAAELLMNCANGNIGMIQYIGNCLQQHRMQNLENLRMGLLAMFKDPEQLHLARCLGLNNGEPDQEQASLISMLRCSGKDEYVSSDGTAKRAWSRLIQSHRAGLSKALYALRSTANEIIVLAGEGKDLTFAHPLQPQAYQWKFKYDTRWGQLSLVNRWVVNFNHETDKRPSSKPTNVVDLVLSWLSHIDIETLLNAGHNVDAEEAAFQSSFHEFAETRFNFDARRNYPVNDGVLRSFIDHYFEEGMAVEFLIRDSADNKVDALPLPRLRAPTWKSLSEHTKRSAGKYRTIADQCRNSKGYATVLLATVGEATIEDEWQAFKEFVRVAKNTHPNSFKDTIMVAVAAFGWATWHVFLHRPDMEPVNFPIPRERLMWKLLPGRVEPEPARRFYPRPKSVWVRQLLPGPPVTLAATPAFKVEPAEDNIASLARALKVECSIVSPSPLRIYRLNYAKEWEEQEEDRVIYANEKNEPYGYIVPQGATFGPPGAVPAEAAGSAGAAASSSSVAPAQIVRIRVVYQGNEVGVTFRQSSSTEAITEAMRRRLRLPVGLPFELLDSEGYGVTIDGSLPEGTYTVPG